MARKPKPTAEKKVDPRYYQLVDAGKAFNYGTFLQALRVTGDNFFEFSEQCFLLSGAEDTSPKDVVTEMQQQQVLPNFKPKEVQIFEALYRKFALDGGITNSTDFGRMWPIYKRAYSLALFLDLHPNENVEAWFGYLLTLPNKELEEKKSGGGKNDPLETKSLEKSAWQLLKDFRTAIEQDCGDKISYSEAIRVLTQERLGLSPEARRGWWAEIHGEAANPLEPALELWLESCQFERDTQAIEHLTLVMEGERDGIESFLADKEVAYTDDDLYAHLVALRSKLMQKAEAAPKPKAKSKSKKASN